MTADQNDFLIGAYRVQPSRNVIIFSGKELKVTPLLMSMLIVLVENQGKTVTKSHLLNQVWGNVSVSEAALFRNISELRRIFGDDAKSQNIIETIPKKGYRLKADVIFIDNKVDKNKLFQADFIHRKKLLLALFIVITLVGFWLLPSDSNQLFLSPKIDHLTSDKAFQRGPRFSASGRYLLYYEINNGQYSTKLKDLNNGKTTTLINDSKDVFTAIFSPDEKVVVYALNNEKVCEIRKISLITKAESKLLDCQLDTMPFIHLDWSSDGTKLLYSIKSEKTNSLVFVIRDIEEQREIKLKVPQDSTIYYPRFSADNRKIAYVTTPYSEGVTHEINVYDIESQSVKVIYRSNDFIFQAVWGENSQDVYFLQGPGKSNAKGLWRINTENQQKQHILNGNFIDMDYNSTKNKFALVKRTQRRNVWTFSDVENPTENNHHQLTDSNLMDREPALDPNGKYLAFISNQSGNNELWLKSLSNGELKQVTYYDNGSMSLPNWLPSGKKISFSISENSVRKFIVYDLESNTFSKVILPEPIDAIDWETDEKLFWTSPTINKNQVNLYQTNLATNQTIAITMLPTCFFRYHSKLGIVFSPYSDSKKLFAYSIDDKQKTLFEDVELSSPTSWSFYENKLFYINRANYQKSMKFAFSIRTYDLISQIDELYTGVRIPRIQDFGRTILSVNKDGVYYTRQDNVTLDLVSISFNKSE